MKLNLRAMQMIALFDARNNIETVILSLQKSSKNIFKWFSDKEMQGNSEKCYLILGTDEPVKMQVEDF